MAAKTTSNIRIKLISLLAFACFLGAAFWQKQTLAEQNDSR